MGGVLTRTLNLQGQGETSVGGRRETSPEAEGGPPSLHSLAAVPPSRPGSPELCSKGYRAESSFLLPCVSRTMKLKEEIQSVS